MRSCAPILKSCAISAAKTFDRTEAWRQMASMVGHWQLRGYGQWVVEEKATGRFADRLGF